MSIETKFTIRNIVIIRLIVRFRQEINFEINFIKLCKTKLNTISLWFKRVRKIESSRDFWSKIEKTISLVIINFKSTIVREIKRFTRQSIESSFFSFVWIDDKTFFQQNFNRFVEIINEYRATRYYRSWLNANEQTMSSRDEIVTSNDSYFTNKTFSNFFFDVSNRTRVKFKSRFFFANLIIFSLIETFVNNQLLINLVIVNNFVNSIVNSSIDSFVDISIIQKSTIRLIKLLIISLIKNQSLRIRFFVINSIWQLTNNKISNSRNNNETFYKN